MASLSPRHTGELTQKNSTHLDWKISDFFSLWRYVDGYNESPPFHFAGVTWFLRVYVSDEDGNVVCSLELWSVKSEQPVRVTFEFGLKSVNGKLYRKGAFGATFEGRYGCGESFFLRRSEMSSGDLFIIGTLKLESQESARKIDVCTGMELNPGAIADLETLSDNFKSLLFKKESCDVVLKVKHKKFKAHKLVLTARSPVFSAMFHHDTLEKRTGVVSIPDCDPDSFQLFLQFVYAGRIENVTFNAASHLYKTADKYDVQKLKDLCVERMSRSLTVQNLCNVCVLADKYGDKELLRAAQDFFNKNMGQVVKTGKWHALLDNNRPLATKLLCEAASKFKM